MNVPKFRAWHKGNKKMLRVDVISIAGECIHICDNVDGWSMDTQVMFNEIELMQWTGFKDKNNVYIYDGDIIKIDDYLHFDDFIGPLIAPVYYAAWGAYQATAEYKGYPQGDTIFCFREICEVIGNIYENPELLEHK